MKTKVKFGHIFLSWRRGSGFARHLVGRIKKSATNGVTFEYLRNNVLEAVKDGFKPYTEFPDLEKVYSKGVLESFGQRLIKTERSDSQAFYDFWAIDPKKRGDKLYMLAMTQAWIPTDNFEFLADFQPSPDLIFVTDIAGLTDQALKPGIVKIGDVLSYSKNPDHPNDTLAVEVYKKDLKIGFIKKVHSGIFYKTRGNLKVQSIDQNGVIKRIFVRVSFDMN